MKLLLKNSIRSLGLAGEVVDVKAGYARNYLLPQGKAIMATEGNVALIEKYKSRRAEEEAQQKASYKVLQEQINDLKITLNLRANASNLLYGSFSSGDIVTQLNNRHINIDKSMVVLEESIKALGDYEVVIKLDSEIQAALKVEILNEHGEIPVIEDNFDAGIEVSSEEEKQEETSEEASSETSNDGEEALADNS